MYFVVLCLASLIPRENNCPQISYIIFRYFLITTIKVNVLVTLRASKKTQIESKSIKNTFFKKSLIRRSTYIYRRSNLSVIILP